MKKNCLSFERARKKRWAVTPSRSHWQSLPMYFLTVNFLVCCVTQDNYAAYGYPFPIAHFSSNFLPPFHYNLGLHSEACYLFGSYFLLPPFANYQYWETKLKQKRSIQIYKFPNHNFHPSNSCNFRNDLPSFNISFCACHQPYMHNGARALHYQKYR